MKDAILMDVSQVRPYDTILCSDGLWRTVCKSNITKCNFMGTRVHGERGIVSVRSGLLTK